MSDYTSFYEGLFTTMHRANQRCEPWHSNYHDHLCECEGCRPMEQDEYEYLLSQVMPTPVVLMEDALIHTAAHPLCADDTCPCHSDAESMIADFWPADWRTAFAEYEAEVTVEMDASHTDERPFCDNPGCRCHHDDERFDRYILFPYRDGLLTLWEAQALLWPEA